MERGGVPHLYPRLLGPAYVPEPLRWLLLVMATGVFVSGARDLYSAAGLPHGAWPWATRRPA